MPDRFELAEDVLGARVLIVDDMPLMQKMIGLTLQKAGFTNLLYADDGDIALEMVDAEQPDLVILDINMPRLSGYEVCKTLRENEKYQTLPILVQSASETPEERVAVFDSGATDFVSKPINQPELLARVKMHLQNRLLIENLQGFRAHMRRELIMAREMQEAILPKDEDIAEIEKAGGLKINHRYQASYELGGDLWGVWKVDDKSAGIFVLDVSGHGVGSALNTFRVQSTIARFQKYFSDPAEFLKRLNMSLVDNFALGQFATVFYGVLCYETNKITYTGAGAPRPFIARGKTIEKLDSAGLPLGISKKAEYENKTTTLEAGDTLFCYSDVLIEATMKNGDMLGEEGLESLFIRHLADAEDTDFLGSMMDEFFGDMEGLLPDDLTAVSIQRSCPGGQA